MPKSDSILGVFGFPNLLPWMPSLSSPVFRYPFYSLPHKYTLIFALSSASSILKILPNSEVLPDISSINAYFYAPQTSQILKNWGKCSNIFSKILHFHIFFLCDIIHYESFLTAMDFRKENHRFLWGKSQRKPFYFFRHFISGMLCLSFMEKSFFESTTDSEITRKICSHSKINFPKSNQQHVIMYKCLSIYIQTWTITKCRNH